MLSLFALLSFQQIWLAIPLVIAFSLVYAATRHEETKPIFLHARRISGTLFLFLILFFAILYFAT